MNKGIALASGDYLCFLNAGDCFHEDDTLQQMVHTINGNELPDVLYGETAIVDEKRHFQRMRRLSAPEVLTWKSFKQGMLVCHQAFFARHTLVEPYDLKFRYSADFDWCVRIMKKARTLHNTHLTIIDYLDEGMTTQNRKASLKEKIPHHGKTLRADKYSGTSCMVCPPAIPQTGTISALPKPVTQVIGTLMYVPYAPALSC